MKSFFIQILLVTSFLCSPSFVQSDNHAQTCLGDWGIEAEFLYWKPCVEDLERAVKSYEAEN